MGYRSEVNAAITAPDEEFFVAMITRLKLEDKLEGCDPLIDMDSDRWDFFKWVRIYKATMRGYYTPPPRDVATKDLSATEWVDMPVVIMEFTTEEALKWYDGYDYPTLWESMVAIADEKGMPWQFVRIGEEQGDIEDNCGFEGGDLLKEYLEAKGMLTGTDAEKDRTLSLYKTALDDGTSMFRVESVIESSENCDINTTLSMGDLLSPKEESNLNPVKQRSESQ